MALDRCPALGTGAALQVRSDRPDDLVDVGVVIGGVVDRLAVDGDPEDAVVAHHEFGGVEAPLQTREDRPLEVQRTVAETTGHAVLDGDAGHDRRWGRRAEKPRGPSRETVESSRSALRHRLSIPVDTCRTDPTAKTMDRSWVAVPVGVVGAAAVLASPLPAGQARVLAITVWCIALWIGTPVPPWFTGLVGIGLIGAVTSTDLALTGFAEPATWLIVFGLLVGAATRQSGLAAAVRTAAFDRIGTETNARVAYRRLLIALCAAGLAFALVLPSALVRVLVLAPVLVEVGEAFEERRARLGLLFGPLFATFYGGVGVLTANVPNILIAGVAESTAGRSIGWTEWFVALFPVMGLARVAVIAVVVAVMYRPAPDSAVTVPETTGGVDPAARRMIAFLLVGVCVWATDPIHGLHPMFGAVLVAALSLSPRIGTLSFAAVEEVDFTIVFFVGAVFAIAAGLTETGVTETAAGALLSVVPTTAPAAVVLAAVFGVTAALALLLEGAAVASVLTPILLSFAATAGLDPAAIAFVEAAALGTYVFPYQSVVLVAVLREPIVESRELIRVTTVLSVATVVVLLPVLIALLVAG